MKTQPFVSLNEDDFNIIRPYFKKYGTRKTDTLNTIVLHWTAGASINSSVDVLHGKGYGYHFLIDKEGKVFQGAPTNKRIAHAGSSYGPKGKDVNSYSIGISFDILDDTQTFTDEMYTACANLIKDLKISIPTLKYITGHHWVSPGRKIDPYTFNFKRLLGELTSGFEIWKTGYTPFPLGLNDCNCIEEDDNGNCIKSSGGCVGQGGERYSERRLSRVISDLSFISDLDTE